MSLKQRPDHWEVTAGMLERAGSYMGFETRRAKGGGHEGYKTLETWAPFQALKQMDAKGLSVVLQRHVPEGVTANDMLEVLKTEHSMTTKTGVKLVPESGLQDKVAQRAAEITAVRYQGQGIGMVVTPQSSSDFARKFGTYLAGYLGAKPVPAGVIKNLNADQVKLDLPSGVEKTPAGRKAIADLERWKRGLRAGHAPSFRKTFDKRMARYVKGFMTAGDAVLDWGSGEPPKILFADDVVTSGSTQTDSARALKELGFDVVANVAVFKEQQA
jgi:hypothetical protein